MTRPTFKRGDQVRMVVPDNPYVHNHVGTITQLEEWGAHVSWHGGSGKFRLFHREMQATVPSGNFCQKCMSGNMVRAGTCLLCLDCGDTSGGCG